MVIFPKSFLRRGTSICVFHILHQFCTCTKRARFVGGKNEEERERETERRSCLCLLGVVVVVRRKRSIIFDRKKKKCNKFLCAIGILAVGKTYLSDLSIDCVYYTFETEKTESRERRGRTGI